MTDVVKRKDSLVKILLTAPMNVGTLQPTTPAPIPTNQINIVTNLTNIASPMAEINDDSSTKLISYFHQFSTKGEKETDPILIDHCYSRPWNWRSDSSYVRPTKTLFIPKTSHSKHNPTLQTQIVVEDSNVIDVESVTPPPTPIYDVDKAKNLMEECERYANYARANEGNEDWEETIPRQNWTEAQESLFSSMAKILNNDRMARLANANTWNEPILRRAIIDKSVQRMRLLMAGISWDPKLTQWLHTILVDHLSTSYLAIYLDILQTMKTKLPSFVEKMMFGPSVTNRVGPTSTESLFPLLKRQWDPVATSLIQDKPKKLPGNPIFIVAPAAPTTTINQSKRLHKWTNLLASMCNVITVQSHIGTSGNRMTMPTCADQMLATLRAKIQEVRNDCPSRPIVLLGFNAGAAVVCQVAEVENVAAVVCMGFPLLTVEGRRGEPDDILLDLQCPVLFVIGQNSHKTSREDMEDIRERMRVETGLVVVGSADDYLRVTKSKRRTEGITQSIVDRCILDEIGEFVGSILLSPYPAPVRQSTIFCPSGPYPENPKRLKVERVRNNSNGSSIESEPPSPQTPKLSRPVGRPPGSGKKKLLHSLSGTISPSSTLPSNPNNASSISSTSLSQSSDENNPNDSNTGLSFITKPDVFRASNNPDALNRAVQSIIPASSVQSTLASVSQLQSMGVISSRSILSTNSTLSNLLQSGIRVASSANNSTMRPNSSVSTGNSIKILESTQISPANAKTLSSGRSGDSTKVTFINSTSSGSKSGNIGNVVLFSDGTKCVRSNPNMVQSIRTIGSAPVMLPVLQNKSQVQIHKQLTNNPGVTKFLQTRRQIITKPRQQATSNLLPPANLTTADILDLPIIFADNDSPLLADNTTEESTSQVVLTPKKQASNKYVVINNKQSLSSQNIHHNILKRSGGTTLKTGLSNTKYARLVFNTNQLQDNDESKPHILITSQKVKSTTNPDVVTISPKKIDTSSSLEHIDLESELKATTVPKPIHTTVVNAQSIKNKPELKHFVTGSKNVTLRVPVTFTRTVSKVTDTNTATEQLVLNRTIANRSRPVIRNTEKYIPSKNYRIDEVYEESFDDPDVEN